MEIYVQSCGVSQEHDYRWLKIYEDGNHHPEIPHILKQASRIENGIKVQLTHQYESQDPSIVVAKDKDSREILLLITALEAFERTKIYGRQVRNSVAWVTQDSKENEQVIRKIVAQAQWNWEELRNEIDEAVDFDPQKGFQVNRKKVEQYFENVQNQVTDSNVSPQDSKIKVVWWDGLSEHVGEGDAKKNSQYIIVAICLVLILIVAIALITHILPGTQREETPPTPLPTPQSNAAPKATPSPILQNQVAPTVTPSPISDSQPPQTKLQPQTIQTITMPSAANPSTEPIKTQQLSPPPKILPMESSQENSLTSDSVSVP